MKCNYCGEDLEEGVLFCKACGKKVDNKAKRSICRKCGTEINEKMKFCPNCGTGIDAAQIDIVDNNEGEETTATNSDKEKSFKSENNSKTGFTADFKDNIDQTWKQSKFFGKIFILAIIITAILLITALILQKPVPIVISIIQVIGIVVAYQMDKDRIRVNIPWIKYLIIWAVLFLSLINIISFTFGNKSDKVVLDTSNEETAKPVQMPVNSVDCLGKNYSDIYLQLSEAGFSNISFEKIEDLAFSDADRVEIIESITLNGDENFDKDTTYNSDSEIIISYHDYANCTVNVHVEFEPNLIFSKYDVDFKFDDITQGTLAHGENGDFELSAKPGKHAVVFANTESSSVNGEETLEVKGDVNASYKISCKNDEVSIEVLYVEDYGEVGDNEILITDSASDYKGRILSDVESEIRLLGFTNIKTHVLFDIVFGVTEEGEVESVSIAGNSEFKRGDVFSDTDEVMIIYHSNVDNDPNKAEEPKETDEPGETDEQVEELIDDNGESDSTVYSTNSYEDAKKGDRGVFAYIKPGQSYDIYYIIDFDEGYVYYFTEGNETDTCDRLKIESGNLNDKIIITYHDDGVEWSEGLHFHYVNNPAVLIMEDNDGFEYEFRTTSLDDALKIRDSKDIVDY